MSTRSLLLALALVAVPSVAVAQGATSEPPVHPHQGFFGGFALHAGEIACEGDACDGVSEAGGVSAHAGWGFSPKVALVFDLWAMGHTEDNLTLTHTIATVNVRYWALPILWLQGGVGGASAAWRYKGPLGLQLEDRTDNVAAVEVAAGLELLKSKRFSLDLQLRVGIGFYEDTAEEQTGRSSSLGVGFTWY